MFSLTIARLVKGNGSIRDRMHNAKLDCHRDTGKSIIEKFRFAIAHKCEKNICEGTTRAYLKTTNDKSLSGFPSRMCRD